jgi:hypothetical protein
MVKSGVRAMDAVQAFLASEAGGRLAVDHGQRCALGAPGPGRRFNLCDACRSTLARV